MAIAEQDWDRLLDQVDVKCPGASRAQIKSDAYDTLHEFLSDSSWWTEDISVPVTASSLTYSLTTSEGQVIRLAGVVDTNNMPLAALMPTPGVLDFKYPFNTSQTVTAVVVKTVSLPTGKHALPLGPANVLPIFGPGILDGVLGRMMNQTAKPYSSVRGAAYHLTRFRKVIAAARTSALRRNTFGAQAWIFPQTFRTTSQKGGVSIGNTSQF